MKREGYIVLLISFLALNTSQSVAQSIPSSRRSEEAVRRKTPALEDEFHNINLTLGNPVFIRIFKESKELEMWIQKEDQFELFKIYDVCYYSGGLGTKTRQGDGKSPEGFYFVTPGQLNPNSNFHLSFNIGYPNRYDREQGYTGGAIMVHGNCVSIGCYAMTDRRIEEIWTIIVKAFENGQRFFRIHIFPFRFADNTLQRHRNSPWYEFWMNLKEGYDYFEERGYPPNVTARNGKYIFE